MSEDLVAVVNMEIFGRFASADDLVMVTCSHVYSFGLTTKRLTVPT